ncbi:MAG: ABC transporter ATP-binding protein [Thermodesulfobacteriota bacterium]
MNPSPILELDGVSSGYGRLTVIQEVSLDVGPGEIITLLGSNGVGKSTTLRTVTGQLKPRSGRLCFHGREIGGLAPNRIARLGLGYCPEGRRVFGNLTVRENLVVGAYRLKDKKEYRRNLDWVFTLFPRLEERAGQLSESLSGGEQQMLAMARALISRPELLLLDEPSLGLAPLMVQLIAETLVEINQAGVSILLVEQNARLALDISHRAFVMDKGRVVVSGEAAELKKDPRIMDIYLGFA